jgi:chromosome segregation ATPase
MIVILALLSLSLGIRFLDPPANCIQDIEDREAYIEELNK